MAVLIECLSVIVRRDRIDERVAGGWPRFLRLVPNATLCADELIARVGFMAEQDTIAFIERLELVGLRFIRDEKPVDLVVVDQLRGPTWPCDWIEFEQVVLPGSKGRVAVCRLAGTPESTLATPLGWTYDGSPSDKPEWLPSNEACQRMVLVGHEPNLDVYLDLSSGRDVYVGRTTKRDPEHDVV